MKTVVFFLCMVSFTMTLQAQDFCSLVVKVVFPGGSEIYDTRPITVEEGDGRIVEKRYERGGAMFCDLGIGPVTIAVGDSRGCGQVIVKNIPPDWGKTTTVTVITNSDPCRVYGLAYGIMGCPMLYRFRDSQKKPIQGVSLNLQAPYIKTFKADEFGRIYITGVNYGSDLVGTATASGYDSTNVTFSCTTQYRRADQFITMSEAQ